MCIVPYYVIFLEELGQDCYVPKFWKDNLSEINIKKTKTKLVNWVKTIEKKWKLTTVGSVWSFSTILFDPVSLVARYDISYFS